MIYLKNITVKDFGGLDSFSAEFGDVAIIAATNGLGKTSIISAVRSIFEGGSDTSLIRLGAKKAEASIEFSNGYKAVKTIDPSGYKLNVTDENGGVIKSPAAKLAEFVGKDILSVQELLQADPKDLASLMLKYLPMTFTPEEVNKAIRVATIKKPLSVIDFNALRQAKYDARTELNRNVKNLRGSIANMSKALPEDDKTDWSNERDRLDEELRANEQQKADVRIEIEAEGSKLKDELKMKAQAELHSIRAEQQVFKGFVDSLNTAFSSYSCELLLESVGALDSRVDAYVKSIKRDSEICDSLNADLEKITAKVAETIAEEIATLETQRAAIASKRGEASAKADQQQQASGVRNAIKEEEARLEGHVSEETILSMVLEDMDKLKALKLRGLPIEDLDIEMDGKKPIIKIGGVQLERLNAQRQLYVLVKFIAEAQAGAGLEFKVITCEGAEMVPSKLIALAEACIEAGIQLLVTVPMENQPLKVMGIEEYKALVEQVAA